MDNYTLTKWTFTILGLLTILFGIVWGLYRWHGLTSWPKVVATVLKSELETSYGAEDGVTYTNRVRFGYLADGRHFESTSAEWGSSSNEEANRAILARYAVGTEHGVLYNPSRPEEILVEPGYTIGFFKVTLFCLFLGGIFAGIGVLLFFLRRQ